MSWKEAFAKGKELVLATTNSNGPHANITISLGMHDGKLLVADCQMDTTRKNLEQSKEICVVGGYYRIKGTVELQNSGTYYDLCVKENDDYKVNQAILVSIKEIFDLDNVQPVTPN